MSQIIQYLASLWWTACGGLPKPNLVHRSMYTQISDCNRLRTIRIGKPRKTRVHEMVVSDTRVTSSTLQFVSGSMLRCSGRRLTWANSCNSPGRKTSTGTLSNQLTNGALQTGVQSVRHLSGLAPTGLPSINSCCRSQGRAGQFHQFPECRKARQVPNTKETDVSSGRPSDCDH
jgi:hypothetical protein